MLNHTLAARLPDRFSFTRKGRTVESHRVRLGEIDVAERRLKIADAAYKDEVPPLPIRVPNGRHEVLAYQWDHPRGPISVCLVVAFRPQRMAVAHSLAIANDMRPDLTAGIIVDSAEVRIGSASALTHPAGLGDGYYPITGVYNFGLFSQAVVLDFKLWHVREVVLLPGQVLDEYGIVVKPG